jgi:hypothetical protein
MRNGSGTSESEGTHFSIDPTCLEERLASWVIDAGQPPLAPARLLEHPADQDGEPRGSATQPHEVVALWTDPKFNERS